MRKYTLPWILWMICLTGITHNAYAVRAYPWPVQVTQPDGSVLTIQKHGDEFLHWTTSGGRLVKQGEDGFYYLAEFLPQGGVVATGARVRPGAFPTAVSAVRPPQIAFKRAGERRAEFARMFAKPTQASALSRTQASASSHAGAPPIAQGNKRFLILLVQFNNLSFVVNNPRDAFFNMLNQDGYAANGGTGSVWNYYYENSSGDFNPQFDVVGPVTLSRAVSYYGANDEKGNNMYERSREMVVEAVKLAKRDFNVDFSVYDNNTDGYIDNVFVFFAGHNEAEGGPDYTIWPHAWSVIENVVMDGVRLYSYACASELRGASGSTMAGIGTYCHEFGHVLGLPDFYDTDGEDNGKARGLGSFSLMSGGNYNNSGRTPPYLNVVERDMLGWYKKSPTEFIKEGTHTLQPVRQNDCYITPTANEGEFFLFEYRSKEGWDEHLPRSGMLIYHVDKSDNRVGGIKASDRWSAWNGINAYADHQCFDLIEAVYPESAVRYEDEVPFPGSTNNTSFTATSSPAFKDHAGYHPGVNITDIADNETNATFSVNFDTSDFAEFYGKVTTSDGEPVPGVTVTFSQKKKDAKPLALDLNLNKNRELFGYNLLAATQESEHVYSTVTNEQGEYFIASELTQGIFVVRVEKEGYNLVVQEVTVSVPGLVRTNFTLFPLAEYREGLLRKHNEWEGYNVGYVDPGIPTYGAVGFSPEELLPYQGDTIATVSFVITGSSASEVGVFVLFDQEKVLEQNVVTPVFGNVTTVDVSAADLTIPEGKTVKFGYYVLGSDYGYPMATDEGPMAYLGGYAGHSIEQLTTPWGSNLNNIIISATVKTKEEEDDPVEANLEIGGEVVDKDGNPLSGVAMTLYYIQPEDNPLPTEDKSQAPGSLHRSGNLLLASGKSRETIETTTTGPDGQYHFTAQSKEEGVYAIHAAKDGYYPVERQTDASIIGEVSENFTLIAWVGSDNNLLRKHGTVFDAVGYGTPGETLYGAVGFSPQEIEAYEGYCITSVSFFAGGTRAEETGVFVLLDNECVFMDIVNNPSFGNVTQVDLTAHDILIPKGKELKVGYYIKGSDSGYPLGIDQGPMVPMGGYAGNRLSSLTTDWKIIHDLDYNLVVSATVAEKDHELFSLGYYMMPFAKEQYKAGDQLVLTLNDAPSVTEVERPLEVRWFFNETQYSSEEVITLEAGSHVVKAVLTFRDYTQTIVQEIFVE